MPPHPPLWSPRWRYLDGRLEYIPFPKYPTWLLAWDLSDIIVSIETIGEIASAAGTAATAAEVSAATAIANAASAQSAADDAQTTAEAALAAAGAIAVDYPNTHFVFPQATKNVTASGFGAYVINTACAFNGACLLTGLNSEVMFQCGLEAGNYEVRMGVIRYNGGGDITLYVDTVSKGTVVCYGAVTDNAYSVGWVVTGLSKGLHTFNLKVTGKQGASSGYNIYASYISVES